MNGKSNFPLIWAHSLSSRRLAKASPRSKPWFRSNDQTRILLVLQAGDARQFQALEELERTAAAGGDVGHLVRKAQLLNRSRRVAAADERDRAGRRDRLGDVPGADGEGIELKYAHRAVPDNRARVLDSVREQLDGLRADVHAHHVFRQLASLVNNRLCIRAKVVAAHRVDREQQLDAL